MRAPKIRGLDHVVFRVRDVERMVRFYAEVFGCRVERESKELGLVQIRAGSALVDLVDLGGPLGQLGGAPPGDEGRNVDHVAFQIENFDPETLRAHLLRHGVAPGEVGRRYGAEGFGPSLYVRDPEGNVLELKGPPDPDGNAAAPDRAGPDPTRGSS